MMRLSEGRSVFDESRAIVNATLRKLQEDLPRSIDAVTISPFAKIPYKAEVLRTGMTYRVVELTQSTLDQIASFRMVSAALTARAVIESSAVFDYVVGKIERATAEANSALADEFLMRSLTGSKLKAHDAIQPIQVLTAIDHRRKEFPMFREMYDNLSEYAHPNWLGVHAPYAVENETEFRVTFAQSFAGGITQREVMVSLSIALVAFVQSRARYDEVFPRFVQTCIADVRKLDQQS